MIFLKCKIRFIYVGFNCKRKKWGKKCLEICAIKGGERSTPNGKNHLKFPFWLFDNLPNDPYKEWNVNFCTKWSRWLMAAGAEAKWLSRELHVGDLEICSDLQELRDYLLLQAFCRWNDRWKNWKFLFPTFSLSQASLTQLSPRQSVAKVHEPEKCK